MKFQSFNEKFCWIDFYSSSYKTNLTFLVKNCAEPIPAGTLNFR